MRYFRKLHEQRWRRPTTRPIQVHPPRRCRSRDRPAPNPQSTRNRYSAEFKVKVALDAIKGEFTISQLGAKYGVHQTMINAWKKQATDKLSAIFEQI
jgi:transposase-like protein